MNLFRLLIVSFLPFISGLALAAINPITDDQFAIGLDVGVAKPTNLGSPTSFPVGFSTYSYGSNTNDIHSVVSGISVNKILTITPLYTLQTGVSAHYLSNMNAKGFLQQGISRPFYQATYSYSVNSYQYLADAKLRRQFNHGFFPYLYLGLGIAVNSAFNYSTSVPGYLTTTPSFKSKTMGSFTYSLGFGVDYLVTPKLSLGLGYRFINLGNTGLGAGIIRNTNISAKLTQSNLYLNTILAQLNYFI